MATYGQTPSFNYWWYTGSGVENQACTKLLTMPANGIVTAIVVYVRGYSGTVNITGGVWNSSRVLICRGATENGVLQGSGSTGGQQWVTSPVSPGHYIAAGTRIYIGWTRPSGQSMVFSTNSGGLSYIAAGSDPPGNLGTLESTIYGANIGDIGAYIVYTPVSAPSVTTNAASAITPTTAQLNGTLNPNSDPTTYHFDWGTTTGYGNSTSSTSGGSGSSNQPVSAGLTGLASGTTYHYRLVATNDVGTTYGADQTFMTVGTPNAPTLNSPANNAAVPAAISGLTLSWTYNSGGAVGGQTAWALKTTPGGGAAQWWNAGTSSWQGTEIFNSGSAASVTIGAANWTPSISYTWTVASQDANGTGPYAPAFTFASEGPPAAPTLTSPLNASYDDLSGSPVFQWAYVPGNAVGGQTGYQFRQKISGAGSYSYWNASTNTWQSSPITNSSTSGQIAFPVGAWANGNTFNWSVATQDAGGLGPFATDFTLTGQAEPAVTVTAPAGVITSTTPAVTWTVALPGSAVQTAFQVRTFNQAQYTAPGFNPANSTAYDDSGVVSSAAGSYTIATVLADDYYRSYVNVTETGNETNNFNQFTAFQVVPYVPATPTITATATTDPTTGCPMIQLVVTTTETHGPEVNILRSDGLYVRSASLTNPAVVSGGTVTVNDYEVTPLTAYSYEAAVLASTMTGSSWSAYSTPAGASLTTTEWWELDPTNPAGAVAAQPISFNPSMTEQSAAHMVLGQDTMNVLASAVLKTDMAATMELFDQGTYSKFLALATSQKTIFLSDPFGFSYYFRIGPAAGGSSGGGGNRAHDSQLLPSTAAAPHRTMNITGIAQPRPPV